MMLTKVAPSAACAAELEAMAPFATRACIAASAMSYTCTS
jgi:hypothetical protein